ncbi:hypothetical protein E2C01_102186 [Portunus trituberculatus]|uniref:Uncharacterized protein n=1 Tax=Portunus trituberculatus TaxID=210409 RepID=A0A5B7KHW5_PORTR|nr:hypothetical protein [Portunus trituberculatus]
MENVMDFFFI